MSGISWKSIINSSLRRLMSRKLPYSPSSILPKTLTIRRWQTSSSAWLPTWLWQPVVVTSSICSNSVHLQVRIVLSSPTNRLFLEPQTNRLPVKTTLGTLRNGQGLSWLKRHNFVIFWYNWTTLGVKVYILLLDSYYYYYYYLFAIKHTMIKYTCKNYKNRQDNKAFKMH